MKMRRQLNKQNDSRHCNSFKIKNIIAYRHKSLQNVENSLSNPQSPKNILNLNCNFKTELQEQKQTPEFGIKYQQSHNEIFKNPNYILPKKKLYLRNFERKRNSQQISHKPLILKNNKIPDVFFNKINILNKNQPNHNQNIKILDNQVNFSLKYQKKTKSESNTLAYKNLKEIITEKISFNKYELKPCQKNINKKYSFFNVNKLEQKIQFPNVYKML